MSRRRYTEDEKTGFLAEFERDGCNAAVFCRERELPYQSFLKWRRKLRAAVEPALPTQGASFVEVELQPGGPSPGRGTPDPGSHGSVPL